ncbi:MAG: Gmad2 immunoglobulin-like domain-containing protein [Candidatus Paceibacterota bacterium]|jgi:hypothetical protein
MKKFIFIVIIVIVVIVLTALVFDWGRNSDTAQVLTQEASVKLDSPEENESVKNPVRISGQAKGTWFFEGSFPVELMDTDGNILATSFATSTEDWMTENFIPFSATLEFIKPTSTKHVLLVLKKDNPSGLPEHDESISVPLILK